MAQGQVVRSSRMVRVGMDRRVVLRVLVGLTLLGMLAEYSSGHWDAVSHLHGGVDTFWYPPHFGIYAGLLIAALMAAAGSILALREPGSIGQRIRNNAALLFVAAMNLVNFTGAPFDAWWHTVYGIDLTIWSPPHIHLLIGMVMAPVACAVFFMPDRQRWSKMQNLTGSEQFQLAIWIFSMLATGWLFVEYDLPGKTVNLLLLSRPDWLYPSLLTAVTMFSLGLIQYASNRIGMATAAALGYVAVRSLITLILGPLVGYPIGLPQPVVIPALVVDLAFLLSVRQAGTRQMLPRVLLVGLIGTLVQVIISPVFAEMTVRMPGASEVQPWIDNAVLLLIAGTLAYTAGTFVGDFLRKLIPSEEPVRAQAG